MERARASRRGDLLPLSVLGGSFRIFRSARFEHRALLQSEGFLRPGEKFDAYMMECGLHLTADLSESRDGVERMHYFYFTTSGHCYDLWFCDDIVSDSEAEQIKDTFQLEASV